MCWRYAEIWKILTNLRILIKNQTEISASVSGDVENQRHLDYEDVPKSETITRLS